MGDPFEQARLGSRYRPMNIVLNIAAAFSVGLIVTALLDNALQLSGSRPVDQSFELSNDDSFRSGIYPPRSTRVIP
jgi:hypothetical protein